MILRERRTTNHKCRRARYEQTDLLYTASRRLLIFPLVTASFCSWHCSPTMHRRWVNKRLIGRIPQCWLDIEQATAMQNTLANSLKVGGTSFSEHVLNVGSRSRLSWSFLLALKGTEPVTRCLNIAQENWLTYIVRVKLHAKIVHHTPGSSALQCSIIICLGSWEVRDCSFCFMSWVFHNPVKGCDSLLLNFPSTTNSRRTCLFCAHLNGKHLWFRAGLIYEPSWLGQCIFTFHV